MTWRNPLTWVSNTKVGIYPCRYYVCNGCLSTYSLLCYTPYLGPQVSFINVEIPLLFLKCYSDMKVSLKLCIRFHGKRLGLSIFIYIMCLLGMRSRPCVASDVTFPIYGLVGRWMKVGFVFQIYFNANNDMRETPTMVIHGCHIRYLGPEELFNDICIYFIICYIKEYPKSRIQPKGRTLGLSP